MTGHGANLLATACRASFLSQAALLKSPSRFPLEQWLGLMLPGSQMPEIPDSGAVVGASVWPSKSP
jgi:hypothetical protein